MEDNQLSSTIRSQVPSHITRDYPRFVEFLVGYFEWLEQEGNPFHTLALHNDRLNFERSFDEYTKHLKYEYLYNIPESVLADKEALIKFSKNFSSYLGTSKSFEFLFKILYDEDVTLVYPKEDILRTSDGEWISDEVVIYTSDSGTNISDLLYKSIEQVYEIAPGVDTTITGVVGNVISRSVGGYKFLELRVLNLSGEIKPEYYIKVGESIEYVMTVGSDITVNDGGSGYVVGDILLLQNAGDYVKVYDEVSTDTFHTELSTLFAESDITVKLNNVETTNFTYDGVYITVNDFVAGDIVEISFPRYDGLIVVDSVGLTGDIKTVNILQPPIGLVDPNKLYSPTNGIDIDITGSGTKDLKGYYLGTRGQLSSYSVLQDSDFYQEYSYVIRTAMDIDIYREVVNKLLHPAGMKMFGDILIRSQISTSVSINDPIYINYKLYDSTFIDEVFYATTYFNLDFADTTSITETIEKTTYFNKSFDESVLYSETYDTTHTSNQFDNAFINELVEKTTYFNKSFEESVLYSETLETTYINNINETTITSENVDVFFDETLGNQTLGTLLFG